MISLLMVFSLFRVNSCKQDDQLCHPYIFFDNVGEDKFYIVVSHQYPDTSFFPQDAQADFISHYSKDFFRINESDWVIERDNEECWEHLFMEKVDLKSDTLMIGVYNDDFKFYKRLDLSLSDLRKKNFRIRL